MHHIEIFDHMVENVVTERCQGSGSDILVVSYELLGGAGAKGFNAKHNFRAMFEAFNEYFAVKAPEPDGSIRMPGRGFKKEDYPEECHKAVGMLRDAWVKPDMFHSCHWDYDCGRKA